MIRVFFGRMRLVSAIAGSVGESTSVEGGLIVGQM